METLPAAATSFFVWIDNGKSGRQRRLRIIHLTANEKKARRAVNQNRHPLVGDPLGRRGLMLGPSLRPGRGRSTPWY